MKLHGFLIGQTETLLGDVLKFAGPADATTSRFFRAHPKLGHAERGVIAEAVFAVLRRKMEYAHLAESGTGTPARRLTLLGLMQTAGRSALKPHVSEAEWSWLDHVAKIDPASLPLRVRTNLPDWIHQALSQRFDADGLAQFAAAVNYPAPLDLRVNVQKATRDQVLDALKASGIEAGETPFAPNGVRVIGKPALTKLSIFQDGLIEVQDEGSQLLCSLMAPRRGEMVVDFCAGAGGKTLALGAAMRSTGRLYAFDVSEKRLAKLKPRLARSGLSNVNPVLIDSEHDAKIKRLAGKIDRVLVDAPCSGLGNAAPQSRPQVAPDARLDRGTRAQAGLDPRQRRAPGEAGRPPGLRDLQRAGGGERGDRRAVPRRASRLRAGAGQQGAGRAAHRARYRRLPVAVAASPCHRRFLRGRAGAAREAGQAGCRQGRRRGGGPRRRGRSRRSQGRRSQGRRRRCGSGRRGELIAGGAMQDPLLSKRLAGVARDFGQPVMIWQLAVLAGTLALAWLLARWLRSRIEARRRAAGRAPGTGASSLDRALFPLAGGVLLLVAQEVGERFFSTSLLQLALVPSSASR